tara:strand:+ start:274 stop:1404 length:1131 start_codon:yes stop_codon:yes gene_type:complete
METKIDENVVTKGAAKGDPLPSGPQGSTPGQGSVEDLGGPTPENYKPDDDSAKLKTPTLSQVKDVVNKGAKPAEKAKGVKEEEEKSEEVVSEEPSKEEETVVAEEPVKEEEVVSEEETSEEEVVAEEQVEEEVINVEEDIEALIAGEELSEEFQEKARTIFQTAIKAKVAELTEEVRASQEEQVAEEVAEFKRILQERVDSYLEYVADEWFNENKLAAENGLKTEMTESFLAGMKGLFEDHYVTIPEEKYDVLNSMVDKLDDMESKLNEQIEKNVALNRRLAESTADVIFADVVDGLAETQKEKLAGLAENVEFESEESYREKLVTLKESYFPSQTGKRDTSENLSEENGQSDGQPVSGMMESYLETLNRVNKLSK